MQMGASIYSVSVQLQRRACPLHIGAPNPIDAVCEDLDRPSAALVARAYVRDRLFGLKAEGVLTTLCVMQRRGRPIFLRSGI